jgi:hypothetical protein
MILKHVGHLLSIVAPEVEGQQAQQPPERALSRARAWIGPHR